VLISGVIDFAAQFAPYKDLAAALRPFALAAGGDSAHDLAHLGRVWRNVLAITDQEGGDREILTAACLLHDCVDVPKDSALRSSASRMAAEKARSVLAGLGWPPDKAGRVAHTIEAHSYSAGIEPETLEAKILQDADRLDAIGHIGIARCFAVSGRLCRPLYDPQDPAAARRDLDDRRFAIDHFRTKLLRLAGSFRTPTGNRLAAARHQIVSDFLEGFLREVSGGPDVL